jgi:hypothetical protein
MKKIFIVLRNSSEHLFFLSLLRKGGCEENVSVDISVILHLASIYRIVTKLSHVNNV